MATRPKNRFSIQEAKNLKVHQDYSSEQIACTGDMAGTESHWESITTNFESVSSQWEHLITDDEDGYVEGTNWVDSGDGPAKSVTITNYTGDSASIIHLQLKIDGSYGDTIPLVFDDFPLTINKMLIDQVKLNTSDGSGGGSGTDEVFSIVSYH